mmetsp:Transcript_16952/g.49639  ORF Transcript_16952/g.49639 Transcript_16952/m.49639 type:complete len:1003 (-) Transcript_16952:88-3096(-)
MALEAAGAAGLACAGTGPEDVDETLVPALLSNGFCALESGLEPAALQRALDGAAELRRSDRFYQPHDLVADGLLGPEGSSSIAELRPPGPDGDPSGLRTVDDLISNVGLDLLPHFGLFGDPSHRSVAVVHEAGAPGEGLKLEDADVTKWLEKFLRHKLMVIVFLGPMEGVLRLQVYGDDDAEAHEVPTPPGTIVILRPDIISHQHVALGKAIAISSFFVQAGHFHKAHRTGGFVMCPPARELDRWAMQRVRELKLQAEEPDLNTDIPRAFQRAMNLNFFTGSVAAVRGLSCNFPGSSAADTFFRTFAPGADVISSVPFLRWDHSLFYDPSPEGWKLARTYSNHGAFMDGIELFDCKFFGLSVHESKNMDPHQRHILETGYDALMRMGMKKNTLMNSTGSVYVGHSFGDWGFVDKAMDMAGGGPTGAAGCVAANRLSFIFGIKGPSMAIDTDASSSLTAVYMTAESIQKKGRALASDFGVGIGAQLMLTPVWWPQHCAMGRLSAKGRCFTFDIGATGYVRGEGVAAVAMKPMVREVDGKVMQQDSDQPFVGVIAGSNINTNGKSPTLGAPNGLAEQEVVTNAVRNAGIAAEDVDAVEAHGAGFLLADVIEVSSLMRAHRYTEEEGPLAITSSKTSVGNMVETSGMGSLIKALLSAQYGFMACSQHLREVNPHMDINEAPVMLLSEHLSYPRQNSLTGVMSQGFGGTNVYAIVWGMLDENKVHIGSFPSSYEHITFWPGGGGYLRKEDRPDRDYQICGSWLEWSTAEPMKDEGNGVYGYTVTLGDNCWEQFQIFLDGDPSKALHPGEPGQPDAVRGPSESLAASTWLIDGRDNTLPLAIEDGQAPKARRAARPGDRYRVRLRVAGRWRAVSWGVEAPLGDGESPPPESFGKYYVSGTWNGWGLEELERQPDAEDLYSATVMLPFGSANFQIVRNRDFAQVFHPGAESREPSGGPALGPDEGGEGLYWSITHTPGAKITIELRRVLEEGKVVRRVSWRPAAALAE